MPTLYVILTLLITSVAAVAQSHPVIETISYQGTGCPEGSTIVAVSSDGQALTVMYDRFLVDSSVYRGLPTKKDCIINVEFKASERTSFAVYRVETRGFAYLEPGAIGVTRTVAKIGGAGFKAIGVTKLTGPYNDSFINATDVPAASRDWTSCRKKNRLVLKTVLGVRPAKGFNGDIESESALPPPVIPFPAGYLAVDSTDASVVETYRLAFTPCRR